MNDINWKGGLFVDCTELNAMLDGLMDDTMSESQRQALEAHRPRHAGARRCAARHNGRAGEGCTAG